MFERLLAIGFYFITAAYFAYSFFFPVETDFWVVRTGLPIMIVEIWTFMMSSEIVKFQQDKGYWADTSKSMGKIMKVLFYVWFVFMIGLFILASFFFLDASLNMFVFAYFIVSLIVKVVTMNSRDNKLLKTKWIYIAGCFLLISILAASYLSILVWNFQQNEIYNQFNQSKGLGLSAAYIFMWGISYFTMLGIASIPYVERKLKALLIQLKKGF